MTAREHDSIEAALKNMEVLAVRRLPIIAADETLVGILTLGSTGLDNRAEFPRRPRTASRAAVLRLSGRGRHGGPIDPS